MKIVPKIIIAILQYYTNSKVILQYFILYASLAIQNIQIVKEIIVSRNTSTTETTDDFILHVTTI